MLKIKFLISFALCFIINASIAQDKRIEISSCESNEPLANVFLISPSNTLIGTSDTKGYIFISDTTSIKNLRVSKFGFNDTLINLSPTQDIAICLSVKNYLLPEFEVSSKQYSIHEQLEAYMEATSRHLLQETDTMFYEYEYIISIPDSNWRGSINGTLKFPLRDYDKLYSGCNNIEYCSTFQVDSSFWKSKFINELSTGHIWWFLNSDNLREGHYLKRRIKNRWEISKKYFDLNTEFEIHGYENRFPNSKVKVMFDKDSIATLYQSQWISQSDKDKKWKKNNFLLSHNLLYTYREKLPLLFNSIYGQLKYKTISGLNYSIVFKMNLISERKIVEHEFCFDHSTWIELNPEYFKKNNLVTTFY